MREIKVQEITAAVSKLCKDSCYYLPEELLAANQQQCVRMPMRKGERCLNLSNAVAVGVYEVLRQWDFADLETHGQLTRFEWK